MAVLVSSAGRDDNDFLSIVKLTKQFTGAAILKLEVEGALSLEDTVGDFFPSVPEDKAGLTVRQLLTHSAGFPGLLGASSAASIRLTKPVCLWGL